MRILLPALNEIQGFGAYQVGFYRDFQRGVSAALRDLGHEVVPFPFAHQEERSHGEVQALYQVLKGRGISAVMDLCCWGYGLSRYTLHHNGRSLPIYDMFDVPYLGVLFDHPYNQAIGAIIAQRLHVACPDLGHPEQIRLAYPELRLKGTVFAPPAVRAAESGEVPNLQGRDVDVLYVGTLAPGALERFWRNPGNGYWRPEYDAELCDAMTDAALGEPERGLHHVFRDTMAQAGPRAPDFDLRSQMRAVEWHLRACYRRDAVSAVARTGVSMHVIGGGWETQDLPANVTRLEGVDYEEIFRFAERSRICLDASTYLDGANDRVFRYALGGAVCFTNAAGYLRGQFGDGMRFYSLRDPRALADGVCDLLARPVELTASAERARRRVLEGHTWHHRVSSLLAALGS